MPLVLRPVHVADVERRPRARGLAREEDSRRVEALRSKQRAGCLECAAFATHNGCPPGRLPRLLKLILLLMLDILLLLMCLMAMLNLLLVLCNICALWFVKVDVYDLSVGFWRGVHVLLPP